MKLFKLALLFFSLVFLSCCDNPNPGIPDRKNDARENTDDVVYLYEV